MLANQLRNLRPRLIKLLTIHKVHPQCFLFGVTSLTPITFFFCLSSYATLPNNTGNLLYKVNGIKAPPNELRTIHLKVLALLQTRREHDFDYIEARALYSSSIASEQRRLSHARHLFTLHGQTFIALEFRKERRILPRYCC